MFTVKHYYANQNYHAWSVSSYFVDLTPPPGSMAAAAIPRTR